MVTGGLRGQSPQNSTRISVAFIAHTWLRDGQAARTRVTIKYQGEHAMTANMIVLDPIAQPSNAPAKVQQGLDGLAGRTVGFIDNAKLNFNHLVDDLGELLVSKY